MLSLIRSAWQCAHNTTENNFLLDLVRWKDKMVKKTRLRKIKMDFSDVCHYEDMLVAAVRKKGVHFIMYNNFLTKKKGLVKLKRRTYGKSYGKM